MEQRLLFFSEKLLEFNKGFTVIFGLADEEDAEEGEEPTEETGNKEPQETVTSADKTYGLMSMMKDYSDFCNCKYSEVWEVNIVEFFQMLAFIKEYKRREAEQLKKYIKQH